MSEELRANPIDFYKDIRLSAIWYPEVPPSNWNLNTTAFAQCHSGLNAYHPLSWIYFGGPSGCYLQYITAVICGASYSPRGLQFIYSGHSVEKSGRFGRVGNTNVFPPFVIDGPGGERIVSVTTCIERFSADKIASFGKPVSYWGTLNYYQVNYFTLTHLYCYINNNTAYNK